MAIVQTIEFPLSKTIANSDAFFDFVKSNFPTKFDGGRVNDTTVQVFFSQTLTADEESILKKYYLAEVDNFERGQSLKSGIVTLVNGAATVSTKGVFDSSVVIIARANTKGTPGHLSVENKVSGSGFSIQSSSVAETSNVYWAII